MRTENLYNGITQVADDLVERAAEPCLPVRKKGSWVSAVAAVAACAVLILTMPRFLHSGGSTDCAEPGFDTPSTSAPGNAAPGAPPAMDAPAEPDTPAAPPGTEEPGYASGITVPWTLDRLYANSNLVAVCTITGESESFYIQGNTETKIYSQQTAIIDRVILGEDTGEPIMIRQPGGTVGQKTEEYDQPTLRVGKQYLLFLVKPDVGLGRYTEGDYYLIRGGRSGSYEKMEQGHFASTRGVKLYESDLVVPEDVAAAQPYSMREDYLTVLQSNLGNGMLTQERYEEAIAKLDEYAVILPPPTTD